MAEPYVPQAGDKVKWWDNVNGDSTGTILTGGTDTQSMVAVDGLSESLPLVLVNDSKLSKVS